MRADGFAFCHFIFRRLSIEMNSVMCTIRRFPDTNHTKTEEFELPKPDDAESLVAGRRRGVTKGDNSEFDWRRRNPK